MHLGSYFQVLACSVCDFVLVVLDSLSYQKAHLRILLLTDTAFVFSFDAAPVFALMLQFGLTGHG